MFDGRPQAWVVQQAGIFLGGAGALGRSRKLCSSPYGSAKAEGLSQKFPTIPDHGCLDTAQRNFVMDHVMRFAAQIEMIPLPYSGTTPR
jgi:hypothetical protein